jgi:hypothetical protein
MNKITISEKEYKELAQKAMRYEYLKEIIEGREDIFSPPPTKDPEEIVKAFRKSKKYSSAFLKSLEKGLKRSSYFKES